MTLMELLVALVIGTLVITLVVQGLGLALSLYERVGRATATLDKEFRTNAWWVDSVASITACANPDHCLQGSPDSFSGYTLTGIMHAPGQRIPVRWAIVDRNDGKQLQVNEGTTDAIPIGDRLPDRARFAYKHPDGRWVSNWDPTTANGRLPVAIRIESDDGVHGLAAFVQRPWARPDYREVLGL